jgi:hypothetical protein
MHPASSPNICIVPLDLVLWEKKKRREKTGIKSATARTVRDLYIHTHFARHPHIVAYINDAMAMILEFHELMDALHQLSVTSHSKAQGQHTIVGNP